ncbi:MAG: hypothetical protein KKD44_24275 [Proteobacteria bacterium]|nr:hypothetical protein [Pseudomonadota bacterium]
MRKVVITGTPPQDWIDKANELTAQLRKAPDSKARNQILADNDGFWRDDRIREWLLKQFANKCWYTEAEESVSSYHVDHFRPKGRITNPDKSREDGYWWLTFNWENYVIAGQLINTKKNDVFPLFDLPRAHVSWSAAQLDTEAIILIDPKTDEARLISFEMDEEDCCTAVPAGGIDGDDLLKAENTIEILGLNRLSRLNSKRGKKWRDCKMAIADFQGAASTAEFRHQKKVLRAAAVSKLQNYIKYESEFSSVAEACIRKCAPEPLVAQVFNS